MNPKHIKTIYSEIRNTQCELDKEKISLHGVYSKIEKHIQDIELLLKQKNELNTIIPIFIMRQWMLGSVHKAKSKLVQACKGNINQLVSNELELAGLWLYQAYSILTIRTFFRSILSRQDRYIYDPNNLKKGDIVLSYKSTSYLRKHLLARLVAIATSSQVTHSLIVSESHPHPTLLCMSPGKKGLNHMSIIPDRGEMYLVMRLEGIEGDKLERVQHEIDVLNEKISLQPRIVAYKFAEFKSWLACLIGFVYVASTFVSQRAITFPNPARRQKGLFCSEIIDVVYKRAGIRLVPRAEHDAVVGPIELFHSPYLRCIGFITHPDDAMCIENEIIEYFRIDTSDSRLENVKRVEDRAWRS